MDRLPIICINLKRRQDRWKEFLAQPGIRAFPRIQRFDAIDGKQLDVLNDPHLSVLARRNLTLGTRRSNYEIAVKNSVAIYHTHMAAWKYLLEKTDAPAIVIMEDDLRIDPDSYAKFKEFMSHPQVQGGDWDMLNPGALVRASTPIDDRISKYDYFYLFHCYVVSRRGAQILLERAFPIEMHVDHYAGFLAQMGQLTVYGPKKQIFYQRDSKSDNFDPSCQTCKIPNAANDMGKYLYNGRLQMYQLEEAALAIAVVLGAVYVWRRYGRR